MARAMKKRAPKPRPKTEAQLIAQGYHVSRGQEDSAYARPGRDIANTGRVSQYPAIRRARNVPGSINTDYVIQRSMTGLNDPRNYLTSRAYQDFARLAPNRDTGVNYPAPKGKVPGSIHNAPPVIRQARPVAIMKPQRPTAVMAPKGKQARAITPPARPVAKKKAVASTPAAQRSRQIAR